MNVDSTIFVPDFATSDTAVLQRWLDQINAFEVTAAQVNEGYERYSRARPEWHEGWSADDEAKGLLSLLRYVEEQGLAPSDIAAEAIIRHHMKMTDAMFAHPMFKGPARDAYLAKAAVEPITLRDLGIDSADEMHPMLDLGVGATSAPICIPDLGEDDLTDDERYVFWKTLSAVPMTMDQLEEGMSARSTEERIDYCRDSGFPDPVLAAQAMEYRWSWVTDAHGNCVDLKTENPGMYYSLNEGLIDPMWFGFEDDTRPSAEHRHESEERRLAKAKVALTRMTA